MNKLIQLMSEDTAELLKEYTLRTVDGGYLDSSLSNCSQVIGALIKYKDPIMEKLLVQMKPKIEEAYGKKLHKTYSLFRIYKEGQVLTRHTDRPACEVSVSVCLGTNADYIWPLYVEGVPYAMKPGQGVLYKGNDQVHWREPLTYTNYLLESDDPYKGNRPRFYHSQVFLHYIEAGGKFDPEHIDDASKGIKV